MKNNLLLSTIFAFAVVVFSSCSAIEGIFKAGVWVGIIVVVVIVALVLWLLGKARK
jgi:uncharacterized membrane protein YkvI